MTDRPAPADPICTHPGCGLPDRLHGAPDRSRLTHSSHWFNDARPAPADRPLTVLDLRRKARDRTPVLWPSMGTYGYVNRVAADGSWADMEWAQSWHDLAYSDRTWRKRQPLGRLSEWRHG